MYLPSFCVVEGGERRVSGSYRWVREIHGLGGESNLTRTKPGLTESLSVGERTVRVEFGS